MARTRGGKNTFVPPRRSLRLKDSIQKKSEVETVEILSDTEADRIKEMNEKDGHEVDQIEEENENDGPEADQIEEENENDGRDADRIEEENENDGPEADQIEVETEKDGPEAERLVEENEKDGRDADRIEEENENDGPEADQIEVETEKDGPEAERLVEENEKDAADQNSKAFTKPKRKQKRKKIAEDIEDDREAVSGDDCEVVGDEDCDEVRYADEGNRDEGNREEDQENHRWNIVDSNVERNCEPNVDSVEDHDDGNIGVEEENCDDFEAEFGPAAREDDGDESDDDSGDDIWDEERIYDGEHACVRSGFSKMSGFTHTLRRQTTFTYATGCDRT
ncbi:PREDICTED: glutamic acid-rich protein-like [Camelina sativa]|uniref:Glutamic acid-rich protein-like n=1 Tax=Camelina sativa TaxID=90675 RepID=A0ABM0ZC97_CAMSA|nr:PREDICTED: glutamic acid-rich protein-like [Camelina sativa]